MIVELRRYRLHAGQRDTLIELFDRELVESQEACGMTIVGQFRDLDEPDHFVWIRAFEDMITRERALTDFYTGPVWRANSAAANATMIDSDDVYLLHPVGANPVVSGERAPIGANAQPAGVVVIPVWQTSGGGPDVAVPERGSVVLELETEHSPNTFPALPVHEDVDVVVSVVSFAGAGDAEPYVRALRSSVLAPRVALLRPTARSALHA